MRRKGRELEPDMPPCRAIGSLDKPQGIFGLGPLAVVVEEVDAVLSVAQLCKRQEKLARAPHIVSKEKTLVQPCREGGSKATEHESEAARRAAGTDSRRIYTVRNTAVLGLVCVQRVQEPSLIVNAGSESSEHEPGPAPRRARPEVVGIPPAAQPVIPSHFSFPRTSHSLALFSPTPHPSGGDSHEAESTLRHRRPLAQSARHDELERRARRI